MTSPNTNTGLPLRTKSTAATQLPPSDGGLIALRYEEIVAGKPPIAVTVAPPRAPPTQIHPALRRPKSGLDSVDESKRDSGLAPTTSSRNTREGSIDTIHAIEEHPLGLEIDFDAPPVVVAKPPLSPLHTHHVQNQTAITLRNSRSSRSMTSGSMKLRKKNSRRGNGLQTPTTSQASSTAAFTGISTAIPTDNLMDPEFLDQISFSKRGSIMLGGKKAVKGHARLNGGRRQPSFSMLAAPTLKILTDDVEKESQQVRSMYEQGTLDWEDGRYASLTSHLRPPGPRESSSSTARAPSPRSPASRHLSPDAYNATPPRPESGLSVRQEYELAGGIEDWEDVNGGDVDRYGFISLKRDSTPGSPEGYKPPQRVSTVLQLASDAPRKKRAFGRSPSAATSRPGFKRTPSRKISARSLNTQASRTSQRSTSRMRAAANFLPGNRDRRWRDEAGDMLTLPPGLADIAENEEGCQVAAMLKKKEFERTEKWRKMAKVVKLGADGEGTEFEFETRNPKLVERTWKGIPDRWRAAAWYSFLKSSAKKQKDSATDDQIVDAFHKLVQQSSADDVQIDLDVPRTINSHIMFRRRYRGGQRLLFRVLHALSLYFPNTGYVQGMASLAATLLCYYDEEACFVMLVRMWTLRGLDKLYEAGFPGLMAALDEFQKKWMSGGEVSKQLDELNIEPTAYGTRWYLTLFNYSIPFPAQLRVWDVFMLLGDSDPSLITEERPFGGGLDILHATSAALIDGTREILLDSDFENAMKVLTSWVPVKDEELLMKVAKAEWKLHRGKKR